MTAYGKRENRCEARYATGSFRCQQDAGHAGPHTNANANHSWTESDPQTAIDTLESVAWDAGVEQELIAIRDARDAAQAEIATLTARCEALEKQRDTFAVLVSEGARIESHRDELGMALAEEITAHENDRDNDALTIVMLKREVVTLKARCEALGQALKEQAITLNEKGSTVLWECNLCGQWDQNNASGVVHESTCLLAGVQ